jgi:hypothetical protein
VHADSRGLEANSVVLVFTDEKQFETRMVGIKITDMQRIAVTAASGVKPLAVIIHGHGLINNFVFAVTVHVRN